MRQPCYHGHYGGLFQGREHSLPRDKRLWTHWVTLDLCQLLYWCRSEVRKSKWEKYIGTSCCCQYLSLLHSHPDTYPFLLTALLCLSLPPPHAFWLQWWQWVVAESLQHAASRGDACKMGVLCMPSALILWHFIFHYCKILCLLAKS